MGEIYVAHDRKLDRVVAVKLLAERLSEDPDLRVRFRREALTAARLSGEPHVVTIFDVGEHEGRPFTVMEHLPGGTLAVRAGQRRRRPRAGARLAGAGGRGPRRRARPRHRPPGRQAGEPPLRQRRQAPGRRLRDRAGHRRDGRHDGAGNGARDGRLPRARAGAGPRDDGRERPLRAGRRRLRAPHRQAPLRARVADRRGRRPHPRDRPARLGAGRPARGRGRRLRPRARQEPGAPVPDRGGVRRRARRGAARRRLRRLRSRRRPRGARARRPWPRWSPESCS